MGKFLPKIGHLFFHEAKLFDYDYGYICLYDGYKLVSKTFVRWIQISFKDNLRMELQVYGKTRGSILMGSFGPDTFLSIHARADFVRANRVMTVLLSFWSSP